uniref:Vacuolar protein sorting 33 homolog B (Yeast) [Strongylocentrotus purpuratus] n=1 Tax=Lepeophtheirus salmonis TaxID=72036 RepID=A0A0K2VAI7_LEPSM
MTAALGVDIRNLVQLSCENLRNVLNQIHGNKDLIIDPTLMKPLDTVAGMSILKSLGVKKIFKFETKACPSIAYSRVYLLSSSLINAKDVIHHFRDKKTSEGEFHIIFLPRILHSIRELFEEEGVYDQIYLHNYMWELIPFDEDLFSLELPCLFSQVFLNGDSSLLPSVSYSLMSIESLYGKITNKVAIGSHAVNVLKQLDVISPSTPQTFNSYFEYAFIMDRDIDYVSTLLSPLTYESLLDEVFGINCGSIELDSRVTTSDKVVKLQLSNKDKTFTKIRNKHIGDIFSYLSVHARQLKQHQKRAENLSVSEMKNFVQNNLKDIQNQYKALSLHIGASEVIQKEKGSFFESMLHIEHGIVRGQCLKEAIQIIEELMAQLCSMDIVIRLMALASICHNGFSSGDYESLRRQFVQAYGFEKMHILRTLQKRGLVFKKDSNRKHSFQTFATKVNLIPKSQESVSLTEPSDPSYVFNGAYTPLISRIVESFMGKGNQTEFMSHLTHLSTRIQFQNKPNRSKFVLIYFIGGYTLAEVASLKILQTIMGHHFVIAGTSNTTGKKIMESVL